jgi:iron(III) transport system substrate-binding protein
MERPNFAPLAIAVSCLALVASPAFAQDHTIPADLIERAEAEDGVLQYYFGRGYEANRALYEAFVQAYPFVRFEVTGGDTLGLVERILNEAASNQPVAEIIQGGPAEEIILSSNDLSMDYRPAGEARVPEELRFTGNYTAPDYFTFHIAYNPDLVSADEVPASLEELTEEQWRGRFGIDVDQIDWFAGQLAYLGEEAGLDLMQRLADNDPIVYAGAQGYELASAGGVPVLANTFSGQLLRYVDAGAPLSVAKTDYVIAQPDMYIGLNQTNSPETVKLFFEFMYTDAAQEIIHTLFKNPVVPGAPLPELLSEALTDDVEQFFVTSENWGDSETRIRQFQELFVASN